MGRKAIDKTINDLDETLRGEIDEALRSEARESASSVFRRFGLAQRGLRLDTFIRYARKLRQTVWTDEPPLDRSTPTIEEIRDRLLVLMYEQAQAGGIKPYELASLFSRVQEHDRISILQEANERAQALFEQKKKEWEDQQEKAKIEADSKLDRVASDRGIPEDVAERIKDLYGIHVTKTTEAA